MNAVVVILIFHQIVLNLWRVAPRQFLKKSSGFSFMHQKFEVFFMIGQSLITAVRIQENIVIYYDIMHSKIVFSYVFDSFFHLRRS